MFNHSLISLLALSCVHVKRFGTLVGDKSQNLGDKSQQPCIYSHALAVSALHTPLDCHPTLTPVSLSADFSLITLALVSITLASCLRKPLDLFLTSVSKRLTAYCTVLLAQIGFAENRRRTLDVTESSFTSSLLCSLMHSVQQTKLRC